MEENVLLRMEGICKSFPGVKALDNAQLSVRAGTVHALMGENGAGKSTLMKCLFGIYSKDAGHIYLDGKEIDFKSSREALDNGVAMVHQELNQALKRTVMDNIWLGRYPLVKKGLPFVSDKQSYNDTKKVFDDLGINVNPRTVMSTMPVSQRQMVEIAKAVSFNSKVIVFDDAIRVIRTGKLRWTTVKTSPYPGFPTDMQAQVCVCMSLAKGTSRLTESVYETRFFGYCAELESMGANIKINGKTATVVGVEELYGATVFAHDLRAGAALVIAGLSAQGTTQVEDIHYVERGYEDLIGKLTALGADIRRVED